MFGFQKLDVYRCAVTFRRPATPLRLSRDYGQTLRTRFAKDDGLDFVLVCFGPDLPIGLVGRRHRRCRRRHRAGQLDRCWSWYG
jgi:hypothetical protein